MTVRRISQILPTRPHHKHIPNDVVASEKPDLVQVIEEAKEPHS